MKTERRHELETNELAIRLGKITEAVQPRARAVVGGIVAVVAIVLIYQYSRSTSTNRREQGWDRYAMAISSGDTFELESLGDEFKSAPVGSWARLVLADQYLTSGVREAFRDRAQSNSELNKAITNYEAVRAEATDELLKQRAHFGLGRSHEALSKLDEATANYQTVVDTWPDSAIAVAAQSRLDDISLDRTKKFYDWFAAQTPQAEFLSNEPGIPGERPDFDLDFESLLAPDGDVQLDLNAPVTDDSVTDDSVTDDTDSANTDSADTGEGDPADTDATDAGSTDDSAESTADTETTEDAATDPIERPSLD